jgi:type III secretion protein Q
MAAVTNPPTIERKDQTELMPALPVDVEVELTRVRLTVGQLAQLRVGHVLPLRMDVSEPVTLRVGDRAVARAELVDIEGELGARILSLVE